MNKFFSILVLVFCCNVFGADDKEERFVQAVQRWKQINKTDDILKLAGQGYIPAQIVKVYISWYFGVQKNAKKDAIKVLEYGKKDDLIRQELRHFYWLAGDIESFFRLQLTVPVARPIILRQAMLVFDEKVWLKENEHLLGYKSTCDIKMGVERSRYMDRYDHAIIGICPGNPYFTRTRLMALIDWGASCFNRVTLFLPDGWSTFTYMAMGHSSEEAEELTKQADEESYHVIFDALHGEGSLIRVKICLASKLEQDPVYQSWFRYVLELYEHDSTFRAVMEETSRQIVGPGGDVQLAVQYLLREMPIFMVPRRLFDAQASFNIYHRVPYFLDYLQSCPLRDPNAGFMLTHVRA